MLLIQALHGKFHTSCNFPRIKKKNKPLGLRDRVQQKGYLLWMIWKQAGKLGRLKMG